MSMRRSGRTAQVVLSSLAVMFGEREEDFDPTSLLAREDLDGYSYRSTSSNSDCLGAKMQS